MSSFRPPTYVLTCIHLCILCIGEVCVMCLCICTYVRTYIFTYIPICILVEGNIKELTYVRTFPMYQLRTDEVDTIFNKT